jgi:formamidopyrimidine-DNA glycosylase
MPELPEVETIKRDLEQKVIKKTITFFKVYKPALIKEPSLSEFRKKIVKQIIIRIIRKGKVLVFELSSGMYLIIHLRIAGWLEYKKEQPKARAVFYLSDGNCLNYMDQRLLGEIRLRKDYAGLRFIKELGPEPFDLNPNEFAKVVKKKKCSIKSLLMDQKTIAGLGNIYAQEALFKAGVHPLRKSCSLTSGEAKQILNATKSILRQAIKNRGSSVDTYRDTQGQRGGMEIRLKVYGKKGKLCPVCRAPIKKITVAGRGTCFCPRCQK